MQILVTEAPQEGDLQAVDAGLSEFNDAEPSLRQVRALSVFAKGRDGALLGGAVGRTLGECCELRQLWVAASSRGTGMGTKLLRAFEEEAFVRGCTLVYLDTFSFQAPDFYARLGYETSLAIHGFATGIVKYTMQKTLGHAQCGA